jgi:hypothetical protein
MSEPTAVAPAIVAALRSICAALPEVVEEEAWVGTRWTVRSQTFAHVLVIDGGWPPAYVRAFGTDGPQTVLTFQAPDDEIDAYRAMGHPFSLPPWRPNIVGLALDDGEHPIDWEEIAELVADSYCELAPRKLAAQVDRPPRAPR